MAVLTAVADPSAEAALVASLEPARLGVRVVRRCIDLPDLLAAAATGTARAALVSGDLRRLDRDALARLAVSGVCVVGLHAAGDEAGERRLRQLGVTQLATLGTAGEQLAARVLAAVRAGPAIGAGTLASFSDPLAAAGRPAAPRAAPALVVETGRVVAVWGPTGAPGRSTVAVGVATELARLGVDTMLVDADPYGGVVAQLLGLLEEAPGLAAAARLANAGSLDVPGLAELARAVEPWLRVLTGITRAERWPELRPHAVAAVHGMARGLATVTVVDCGFCLEQDEELVYDVAAPRRNGATVTTIEAADLVLAVGTADPVGLARLVRGLAELRDVVPAATVRVVVNRVRRGVVGAGDPRVEIVDALARYAGVVDPVLVPFDPTAVDAASRDGRCLADVAPRSPVRLALRALAAEVGQVPAAAASRRTRRLAFRR